MTKSAISLANCIGPLGTLFFTCILVLGCATSTTRNIAKIDAVMFNYDSSYSVNLWYTIDALSGNGLFSTSSNAYREFWNKQFGLAEQDSVLLNEYSSLVSAKKGYEEGPQLSSVIPRNAEGIYESRKIGAILTSGRSVDEVMQELKPIFSKDEMDRLQQIYRHFDQKFLSIWPQLRYVRDQQVQTQLFFQRPEMREFLASAFHFYGIEGKLEPIKLNFVWRPQASDKNEKAQMLGDYINLELTQGSDPRAILDVVVHELCHVFWHHMPLSVQSEVLNQHFEADGLLAPLGYELLNESLASAWGAGMFLERFRPDEFKKVKETPNGFYNNPEIDRYSKAILPVLKNHIERKTSISGGFVRDAMLEFAKLTGNSRVLIRDLLPNSLRIYSSRAYQIARPIFRKERIDGWNYQPLNSEEAQAFFDRFPAVTTVIVATREDLREAGSQTIFAKAETSLAAKLSKDLQGFMSFKRRPKGGVSLIVVGKDEKDVEELIHRLLSGSIGRSATEGYVSQSGR